MTTTRRFRWIALLAALPVVGAAEPVQDAGLSPLATAPLPLVLKDGRIARVDIYRIPFATGSAEPDPGAARELDRLARSWATDCFLTAQAIGHVAPGPGRDGDTLAAHRLARARADRVQATLVAEGLPEPAIASVWDWQFSVPESRVTLWVFQLVPGEDCRGTPLAARGGDGPPSQPPASTAAGSPGSAEPPPTMSAGTAGDGTAPAVAADAAAGETTRAAREAPAAAAEELAAVTAPAGDPGEGPPSTPGMAAEQASAQAPASPDGVGTGTGGRAPAALAPTEAGGPAVAATGDARPSEAGDTAMPPEAARKTATATPAAREEQPRTGTVELAVQFDVNSSFLPRGATAELRRFAERLGEGRWAVRLEGAVAADDVRNARTPEQARRYSEWLTSRRVGRIRRWLERHLGERIVEVEERLVENDPSRRVVVRARRLP